VDAGAAGWTGLRGSVARLRINSMITVYIWLFQGKDIAWGHAYMAVQNTYMSWWPEKPGQVPSKVHRNIYASYPIRYRTFNDDVRDERHAPDARVIINGLEEAPILDWWQSFGLAREGVRYAGPPLPWRTLDLNCSTVVATGLKKGGGDKYASWFSSTCLIWTPNAVLRYASAIAEGLAKRAASQTGLGAKKR
jgi:hypothetical protein